MYETIIMYSFLDNLDKVNFPSELVEVPLYKSLITTLAPISGSPSWFLTLPVITDWAVASYKMKNEKIKNPELSKVEIKSSIKNNIITLERFKFKFAGFRPRIEGTTSLDGRLNIKMRLGLPPLGIVGIPMTITGNKDNPKVKIGRKSEDLEETEDKD